MHEYNVPIYRDIARLRDLFALIGCKKSSSILCELQQQKSPFQHTFVQLSLQFWYACLCLRFHIVAQLHKDCY